MAMFIPTVGKPAPFPQQSSLSRRMDLPSVSSTVPTGLPQHVHDKGVPQALLGLLRRLVYELARQVLRQHLRFSAVCPLSRFLSLSLSGALRMNNHELPWATMVILGHVRGVNHCPSHETPWRGMLSISPRDYIGLCASRCSMDQYP